MNINLLNLFILVAVTLVVSAAEKPNLVLIVADDCTYLDLGIYGGQAKTPNLNRLAEQGMQMSRCFQAAPMCSPTRHNLYTGIYPVKSGAWPNHTNVYSGTKSIAHYLKAAGYRVALSGKTHIAPRASFPFEYSQEFNQADPAIAKPYPAIEKLLVYSKKSGTPFCLIACSDEPHEPYTKGDTSVYDPASLKLPPSFVDTPVTREKYSKYLAEITYFDAQCGALFALLDKHDLTKNTMVMVVSEQGSTFPFAKWTCYEMGLASGMIVKWPGKIKPGSKSNALVEYVDVTPTFLDAAALKTPETMDGRSFLPVLTGKDTEHKKYTYGIQTTRGIIAGSENYAVRSAGTKTHRYIRNLNHTEPFKNQVTLVNAKNDNLWATWLQKGKAGDQHALDMTKRYQYRPAEELYDVVNDPHCLINLIDDPQLKEIQNDLSARLDAWMESQGDKGLATEALAVSRQLGSRNDKKKK
jgi:N-sulfoglucosamine sulfohydrolase